jgi:AraC-like DNA-binding protein
VHLRRARDHADRHYTEQLDLAQLAAITGISKYHFQRLFRATYGRSPAAMVLVQHRAWKPEDFD